MLPPAVLSRLPGAILHDQRVEALPGGGFLRVSLLESPAVDHRIRIEEIYEPGVGGVLEATTLQGYRADELLAAVTSQGAAERMAAQQGWELIAYDPQFNFAQLRLPNASLDTYDNALGQLMAQPEVVHGSGHHMVWALNVAEPISGPAVYALEVAYAPEEEVLAVVAAGPNFPEVNAVSVPNDPNYPSEWQVRNINPEPAWDIIDAAYKNDRTPVVLAVVDTGCHMTHSDMDYWVNPGEIPDNGIDDDNNGYKDDVQGWNFDASNNNPHSSGGHGVTVSTLAGAINDNGNLGVSPAGRVKIMALKGLSSNGSGSLFSVMAGVTYAVNNGADIVNCSFVGGDDFYWRSIMQNAANNGVLVCAGAGNNNQDLGKVGGNFHPACTDSPNILAVGAVDSSDNPRNTNFGKPWVDLFAPGGATSFSTPIVSSSAALLMGDDPKAHYSVIMERILAGVDVLPSTDGKVNSDGRLNLYGALLQNTLRRPNNVQVSQHTGYNRVTWNDRSTSETGFVVERTADDPDNYDDPDSIFNPARYIVLTTNVPANATSYNDSSADPGTTYFYRVRAKDADGWSSRNPTTRVTFSGDPDPLPHLAPANLSASLNASDHVVLSWGDASQREDSYRVERRVGTGTYTTVATLPAGSTGYTDTSVADGTSYTYQVSAIDPGNVIASSTVSIATPAKPPHVAPGGLTAAAPDHTGVTLSWTDQSAREVAYTVERQSGGGSFTLLATLNADSESYADASVSAGAFYTYRVTATDSDGIEVASTATVTVPNEPVGGDPLVGANAPDTDANLALSATITTSRTFGRGKATDVLYDFAKGAYVTSSSWAEYGLKYGENVGVLSENNPLELRFSWGSPVNFNRFTVGGMYPNQGHWARNTRWKLQYLPASSSTWVTLTSGLGGWLDNGLLAWGGPAQAPVSADAVRLIFYSNGNSALRSTHVRARGGQGDGSATPALTIQFLGSYVVTLPHLAPGNLSASATGPTSVDLSWDDQSERETLYRVERRIGSGSYTLITDLPAGSTSYTDTTASADTAYTYRISAVDAGGDAASSTVSVTTQALPHLAPGNLSASATGPTSVALSWDDQSERETLYRVERRIGTGSYTLITDLPAGSTSYTDTTASADTAYTYRISAVDAGGNAVSSTVSVTTQALPHLAPGNLSASATSPTSVALSWDDQSERETLYRVERRIGSGSYTLITDLPAGSTSYTDTTASADTSYTYRISAVDAGGDAVSSTVSVTTQALPHLAPGNLTASATSPISVALSWDDLSERETLYRVERRIGSGSYSLVTDLPAGSTAYTDTTASADTAYTYRISAVDAGGDAVSSSVSVTTQALPHLAPGNLSASATSPTSVALSWDDLSERETLYRVERRIGSGSYTQLTDLPAGSTSYTDTTASADTAYTYRISAVDAGGDMVSSTVSVTTQAAALGGFNAPDSEVNLALSAAISTNRPFRRGRATDVLYDFDTGHYVTSSRWGEYGLNYGENVGVLHEGNALELRFSWSSPVNFNRFTAGGMYPNQSHWARNTRWKLQYLPVGESAWATLSSGLGGWLENGQLAWGGASETPLSADAVRLIFYSNGNSALRSTHIRARGGNGDGGATPALTIQFLGNHEVGLAHAAPGSLAASATSPTNVALSWDDLSERETLYRIERKTSTGNYVQLTDLPAGSTTFTDTSASPGTAYTYRVSAVDAGGDAVSSTVSVITQALVLPSLPAGLSGSALSATEIALSWDALQDADTIELQLARNSDPLATLDIQPPLAGDATGVVLTDLVAASTYTVRIRGANTQGVGLWSQTLAVLTPEVQNVALPEPSLYWTFSEGSGSVVRDSIENTALNFSGMVGWANTAGGSVLDFVGQGRARTLIVSQINNRWQRQYSIGLWVRVPADSSGNEILWEQGGWVRGLCIYLQNGKLYAGGWNRVTSESNWNGTWIGGATVADASWHHIALTLDGDETVRPDRMKLYLDGSEIGSGPASQLWNHTDGIGLGGVEDESRFPWGSITSLNGFTGQVASLKIFNNTLVPEDVALLASAAPTSAGVLAASTQVPEPLHAWALDEGFGPSAWSTSSADVVAVLPDASWQMSTSETNPYAVRVGPSGGVDLGVPTGVSAYARSTQTVSFWFYPEDFTDGARQVLFDQGGSASGLNVYYEAGQLYAGSWNSALHDASWQGEWVPLGLPPSHRWHHIVLVLEGSETPGAGTLSVYLNGAFVAEARASNLAGDPDGDGLGHQQGLSRYPGTNTGPSFPFMGLVDALSLWDVALTPAQIQELNRSF